MHSLVQDLEVMQGKGSALHFNTPLTSHALLISHLHMYFVALFMELGDLQSSREMFCMQSCNLLRNFEMLLNIFFI